jgi:tetratricopeptide (TPR) repeat protein
MNNHLLPKPIVVLIVILFSFCFMGRSFAFEAKTVSAIKNISDIKQEQAKKYRELGLGYQRIGDLAQALSFYQKAIAIYPDFAVAYNDMGVVYETMGFFDQAEENYLISSKIDPTYSSVYTNLALFYEGQRNLEKAAFYWNKRAVVGAPGDPLTQKAKNRLGDIRLSLSGRPSSDQREDEIMGLMKDIVEDKTEFNKNDESLAQKHFKKAKKSFDNGDMATAIKEALDAKYLDQDNPEIEAFIEKAERRALTR